MTTQTAAPPRAAVAPAAAHRLTFPRVLRSEWIKLATLRSTWWSIAIVAVITIGIATLLAQFPEGAGARPIMVVVAPIQFAMLLAGILGAIAVTGEYSTGMIRSTLTADPVRGQVLAAKATVLAAFLFVSSLAIFVVAAVVVSPILAAHDTAIDWTDVRGSIVPLLVAALTMSVFALIGVSFGFLIRSGAGAIAATVALLFVMPIVVSMFGMAGPSWEWITDLGAYLPSNAAQNAVMPQENWGLREPVAFLALFGWVVAGLLGSWAALRTRDA